MFDMRVKNVDVGVTFCVEISMGTQPCTGSASSGDAADCITAQSNSFRNRQKEYMAETRMRVVLVVSGGGCLHG